MENKINIVELLKGCPMGMELDCTMYNGVSLLSVDDRKDITFPIIVIIEDGNPIPLTKYGQYTNADFAKCVIFPKGKTSWEGFQRPFKDGDIVTWKDRGSLVTFIYKERKDIAVVKHHFALYTGSLGTVTTGEISLVESEIVFATEEEKQKLFDAIKANGYKWNAETKTLEKLVEPKFKVGDRIKRKDGEYNFSVIITEFDGDYYDCVNDDAQCGTIYIESQDEWELVPNKFDITTLKPFNKVLVRNTNKDYWNISYFGYTANEDKRYSMCIANIGFYQCIPYEGNEHLLGKTDDCDEYYKTWE